MTQALKMQHLISSARAARLSRLLLLLLMLIAFPALAHAETLGAFVYPLMSPRISSNYGMRIHPIRRYSRYHRGIDLAAPLGTPIRSIASGMVVFADPYADYGNLIVVQHSNGMTTHYGHCQEIKVRPGQRVVAGQIIGSVGSTGVSTGPHLHLEVRLNGEARNPDKAIPGLRIEAEG